MAQCIIPKNYTSQLTVKETERAIVEIKNFFQTALSTELNLTRVTAPLFVERGTGINDDLNGVERPVNFPVKAMDERVMEIVHSLAKWRRLKIADMQLPAGFGIYTDMNAIRADEDLDNIHSLYVDQWDWEMAIDESQRNLAFLKKTVEKIYRCLRRTEFYLYDTHAHLTPRLPEDIYFIHAEELYEMYPTLSAKERENEITKKYGAVFIIGIGHPLKNDEAHDGRAPDYDDWLSETENGYRGLNGDLLVWNSVLEQALELSSMGIRVSAESMLKQLKLLGQEERTKLFYHQKLLNGELPFTIGGGIGQSRLCQFFLRKAHIGETQASVWTEEMRAECSANGIHLL